MEIRMSPDLQADAQFAFYQYRAGVVTDPYTILDSHRLFAVELLCDGVVTGDDVRESVNGLIAALNNGTAHRKAKRAGLTSADIKLISEEV